MITLLSAIYKNGADLVEEVKRRIARGDDVNRVTEYGESALRIAANLGRFDVVEIFLDAGADLGQLGWSRTIHEVVYGTATSITTSVQRHEDLEATDFWTRTPFLFAVQLGDTEKAQLLLDLGANRLAVGRCGKTPMQYAVQGNHVRMLQWLVNQGFDIESTDDYLETPLIAAAEQGMVDCLAFLIECGADIHKANQANDRAINVATSMEMVRILVDNGAEIAHIGPEMRIVLLGVAHETEVQVSPDDYFANKNRRFGTRNPEHMDNPFWLAMVRSGSTAWRASDKFADYNGRGRLPVWCYDRFGRSTTVLPDGRIIEIAGEHEDHYDPDFCIYNDVTEFKTDGSIRIFGYPESVFRPTDFHTATLLDDCILIIGCLGYPKERQFGHTPVYRLDIKSFQIREIKTKGDQPGWIHRHKARLDGPNCVIVSAGHIGRSLDTPDIENVDEWSLNLKTWVWTRKTARCWPQWTFARADGKQNHLWHIRQALWTRNANWKEEFIRDMSKLAELLGHEPDLDSVRTLYQVEGLTSPQPTNKAEGRVLNAYVDGVLIRMNEDHWGVHTMAEGELSDAKLKAFQDGVLANLSRLEGAAWEVK